MGVSVFDVTYAHRASNGNSCSITLKPSLILVSGLSGHFSVNGTNINILYMYKW